MNIRLVIVRTVRIANLKNIVEAHADVRLVGVLAPSNLLIKRSGFVHGVFESGELKVRFTRGGRFLLPLFHFVGVGVGAAMLLYFFVVAGIFFRFHVRVGTCAVRVGGGASGT
jgi:hypothetical protein